MKIIPVITVLLSTYFSIGQKSYYFSEPLPSGNQTVTHVDNKYFGIYTAESKVRSYEFNETGVYVISTTISSIGRDLIRESTTYDVRDGLIFGVVKDDSIPCVLKDDRYYFGVKNRDLLVGTGSKHKLTKIDASTYMLNYHENDLFIPSIVKFDGRKIYIQEFNYDFETKVFDHIQEQLIVKGEYHDIVILSPTSDEYTKMLSLNIFDDATMYKRSKRY